MGNGPDLCCSGDFQRHPILKDRPGEISDYVRCYLHLLRPVRGAVKDFQLADNPQKQYQKRNKKTRTSNR